MSKGSVWNKGKHNGGPPKGSKVQGKGKAKASTYTDLTVTAKATEDSNGGERNRIDQIKPMKRENWVERQKPVKRDSHNE